MIIYPAIDLKGGKCVRLEQGDMNKVKIFDDYPYRKAIDFENKGCEWIHIIDLDGAVKGESVNGSAVLDIIKNVKVPVQLGGGIRSIDDIEKWLSKGVSRVILGTIAVKNQAIVKEACKLFPGKIAVGIDARQGKVAIEGWLDGTDITYVDLALEFIDSGVSAIIYTDINRDGILKGPDIKGSCELVEKSSIPVILSGGVSSVEDIRAIKASGQSFNGVIIGKAIYENKIDLKEAIEVAKSN